MLVERHDVGLVEHDSPRRWFSDAYFELIVWEDEAGVRTLRQSLPQLASLLAPPVPMPIHAWPESSPPS